MTHDDDHHAHDPDAVRLAVLTVSSSRDPDQDASGDAIETATEDAEATVTVRDLVTDDEASIRERIASLRDRDDVDAIVSTGGTGLTPDDVTVEAARALFDTEIPGFGEQFRARSVEEVGPMAMLSRATAGVSEGVPVFCLPGSEQAARFGTSELILPVVGHAVGLAGGGHAHGDGHDSHDHAHGSHEHGDHHGHGGDHE